MWRRVIKQYKRKPMKSKNEKGAGGGREKILRIMILVYSVLWGVNMAYGMEFGGFEVEVGVGTGEVSDGWDSGGVNDTGTGANMDASTDVGTDVGTSADIGTNVDAGADGTTDTVTGVTGVDVNTFNDAEMVPEVESSSKTENVPKAESASKTESTPKVESTSKAKNTHKVENEQKADTISTVEKKEKVEEESTTENTSKEETLTIIPTVTVKPTKTPEITLEASVIEDLEIELTDELTVLEFFEEQENYEQKKLKSYQYKAGGIVGEEVVFEIDSVNVIHILSFRINGKECEWKFHGKNLIGKNKSESLEMNVEILYLCNEEDVHIILTEE